MPDAALAFGRCLPRRLRVSTQAVAARQATLLRRQSAVLRQEFGAVLGPFDADAVREAAARLQDVPLEELLQRGEMLMRSIDRRIAAWSMDAGLLAEVRERVAPVLAGTVLDQVRRTAATVAEEPR